MKKFRFNLDTLLNIRRKKEEAAQKEVMFAQAELLKVMNVLEELKNESSLFEDELRNKQQGTKHVEDFREYLSYLQSLKKKMALQQDEVFKSQNILAQRRKDVAEAMKDKKIIETIKDKQYTEWKENIHKLEAKLLDELSTIRHMRQKEGS